MTGFLLFAFVASFTPGPTNILVMASASRCGLRATWPLIIGSAGSAAGLVWAAGVGLAQPLIAFPLVRNGLSAVGVVWLAWLAWQLFCSAGQSMTDPSDIEQEAEPRPGALTGALLQLVNPKTWMMALAAVTVFASAGQATGHGATTRAVLFLTVALAGLTAWGALGRYSRGRFGRPGLRLWFDRSMAALLLIAAGLSLLF